jgi:hypothetical protein
MKKESYELFKNEKIETILNILESELKKRNESPFWTDKVIPFAHAILSVLIPLRDTDMLFNPEGEAESELTLELFFRWNDFVSLKSLAFTIQKSNDAYELLRTNLDNTICKNYKNINLKPLGDYLAKNRVNLDNESLDFPISSYNLHQGVSNVIKSLLQNKNGKIVKSSSEHWNSIFLNTDDSKLGWYEEDASKTFQLLNCIPKWKNSTIFIPGAGTSVLVEKLFIKDVKLVLNDISIEALNKLKEKMQNNKKIVWLCQDISHPISDAITNIDIWIDRAVLHFLTDEEDITGYFKNVKSKLKVGGYAIFAEFSKTGALKCAGLRVHQYNIEELSQRLGSSFKLISHFDYTYVNPNGAQKPYIYGLYKRIS